MRKALLQNEVVLTPRRILLSQDSFSNSFYISPPPPSQSHLALLIFDNPKALYLDLQVHECWFHAQNMEYGKMLLQLLHIFHSDRKSKVDPCSSMKVRPDSSLEPCLQLTWMWQRPQHRFIKVGKHFQNH